MSKLWCFSTGHDELATTTTTNMLGWAYIYLTAPCVVKFSTAVITSLFCLFCLWFFLYKMGLGRQSAAKEKGADGTKTVPREGQLYASTHYFAKMGLVFGLQMLIPYAFGNINRSPGYLIEFLFVVSFGASSICVLAMVRDEKASNAEKHPLILRVWWVAFFLLCTWAVISAVIQYSRGVYQWDHNAFIYLEVMVFFGWSTFFLVIAIRGETGLIVEEGFKKPILYEA